MRARDQDEWVDIACAPAGRIAAWQRRRVLGHGETELCEEKCLAAGTYEIPVTIAGRVVRAQLTVEPGDGAPRVLRIVCGG